MFLKKILKSLFYHMGFAITRVSKHKIDEQDANNLAKAYYVEEGKKFRWLSEYNFQSIIDIGANEGQFAKKIRTIFPNAEIHCFEPLKEAFERLMINFSNEKNFLGYNFGLGEVSESKKIFFNEYSPSSSLLEMLELHKSNFDYAVDTTTETISIRKLDEVFPETVKRPLLVKIDVQGYEMFVLKGGTTIINQAEVVIIETSFYPLYAGQPLFEEIYSYFITNGFRYVGNIEQLASPNDHRILQADAVFCRNLR
jgi:FkbM family methyltransferase